MTSGENKFMVIFVRISWANFIKERKWHYSMFTDNSNLDEKICIVTCSEKMQRHCQQCAD